MTSNHIHDESKVLTRATNQHLENGAVHFAVDLDLERKVLRKIDAFLLPMLSFLLLVAFLDRTNIGNARIQGLEKDLNMHDNQYNVALFIFFVPYMILDVPANICMKKLRPSRYLPTLMFCWGESPYFFIACPHLTYGRSCHHRCRYDPELCRSRRLSRVPRRIRGRLLPWSNLLALHVLHTL